MFLFYAKLFTVIYVTVMDNKPLLNARNTIERFIAKLNSYVILADIFGGKFVCFQDL